MVTDEISTGGVDSILDGLDLSGYQGWKAFAERLDKLIAAGCLRKIPALKGKPHAYEEWYVEDKTGNIFIYRPPEDRPTTIWEKVDLFAPEPELEPERPSRNVLELDLRDVPVGPRSRREALSLLTCLFMLIGFGKIETVDRPFPAVPGERTETWFRDPRSGIVYKLVEGDGEDDSFWGPVPPHELHVKAQ
jgi:hypothetical protein